MSDEQDESRREGEELQSTSDHAVPAQRQTVSRRSALRGAGSLAIGVGLGACDIPDSDETEGESQDEGDEQDPIGEARSAIGTTFAPFAWNPAIDVNGDIQAYAAPSVAAGQTIDFKVSAAQGYKLSIRRQGWVSQTAKDWIAAPNVATVPNGSNVRQKYGPGSYVHVGRALQQDAQISQLTLECWVRPFTFNPHWQGILTQYHYPTSCGFGLFIEGGTPDGNGGSDGGRVACYFGNVGQFDDNHLYYGPKLYNGNWYHVAARNDNGTIRLIVNGVEYTPTNIHGSSAGVGSVVPGLGALRLGAYGEDDTTVGFLDGDIAMPVIYASAVPTSFLQDRYKSAQGLIAGQAAAAPTVPVNGTNVVVDSCWPLTEEHGPDVADAKGGRPGFIVNRATWMVGGPTKLPVDPPEFPDPMDPAQMQAPAARGHGLRFAQDDIYDMGWGTTHSYTIPSDVPSGLYLARFESIVAGAFTAYDVHFVVRLAAGAPKAPIAVLTNTTTWYAYRGDALNAGETGFADSITSFYKPHKSGHATYMVGRNMPLSHVDRRYDTDDAGINQAGYYGHLLRAERPMHTWLEQSGYDYDLYSDIDLHDGIVPLSQYRVLIIAGHAEYWSKEMYERLQTFVDAGGRVICASGNTLFWRVSIDTGVIQCRKYASSAAADATPQCGQSTVGSGGPTAECYHEAPLPGDRVRGGLMRDCGYPAWKALGSECSGFGMEFAPTKVAMDSHEFFNGPEDMGVVNGTMLHPLHTGHEFDASIATVAGYSVPNSTQPPLTPPLPTNVEVIARSFGVPYTSKDGCHSVTNEVFTYGAEWLRPTPNIPISEMTVQTRANGGKVFATGSIATSMTLLTEADAAPPLSGTRTMGKLMRNALHYMGVQSWYTRFVVTATNKLFMSTFNGATSSAWQQIGANVLGPVSAIVLAPNKIAVFVIGMDDSLQVRQFTMLANGTFSLAATWLGLGTPGVGLTGRPAVVRWARKNLSVFVRSATNNHLYEKRYDGTNWGGWIDLGGGVASDAAATVQDAKRIGLAVRNTANGISYQFSVNGNWSGWTGSGTPNGGGAFAGEVSMIAYNGSHVRLFAKKSGTNELQTKLWNGEAWSPGPALTAPWGNLGGTVGTRPAIACFGPNQFTVLTAVSNQLKTTFYSAGWGGWGDLGHAVSGDISATTFQGENLVVLVGTPTGAVHEITTDGPSWKSWVDVSIPGESFRSAALVSWTRVT